MKRFVMREPLVAWAIFQHDEDEYYLEDDDYEAWMFHSAYWNRQMARDLAKVVNGRTRVVKIRYELCETGK